MKIVFACFLLLPAVFCYAQKELQTNLNSHQSFWKTGHTNLPFWNSTFYHNGGQGYIDTFSISGNKFRLIHNDSLYDGIIETYKNGQWIKNLEFENLGNHNDYDRTRDVNSDGYNDLILSWKWETEVFLFNPETKLFYDSSFRLPEEWTLLDEDKKIFCNFWSHWYVHENSSKLYTFKNNQPVTLFYLKYIGNKSKEDYTIKKVILYKATDSKTDLKIKEIVVNSDEFDDLNFWKSNYKKLLGYP